MQASLWQLEVYTNFSAGVLGIVAVIALGASPLHLLWWFPLSVVLGVVVLMFPAGVTFTMACLGLLAGLKPRQDSSTKRR
jgi:hypothetical protein